MTLLDSSAVFALAHSGDDHHVAAKERLRALDAQGEDLLLHTYVLLESFALMRRRLGFAVADEATRQLARLPLVVVDREIHDRALEVLRRFRGERPSLVDAVSCVVMRDRGMDTAFSFDADFSRMGFRLFGIP